MSVVSDWGYAFVHMVMDGNSMKSTQRDVFGGGQAAVPGFVSDGDYSMRTRGALAHALNEGVQAGVVNPSLVELIHLLASLAISKGHYCDAEALYNLVLDARKRVLGSVHQDVADSLTRLSQLFKLTERDEEARDLELRARCMVAQ